MKLIVGLGNPGTQYEHTRHNVGFRVIDLVAQRYQISMQTEKFHAWFGTGMMGSEKVVLLKPTTFMNRSGQAILAAVKFYRLESDDLIVVYDDVALDLGRLRIRKQGSAGGHNGLGDAITRLGSDAFCRLRVGIGKPIGSQTQYVLGRFAPDEQETIDKAVTRAADAVCIWVNNGVDESMNRYNVNNGEPGDQ